MNTNATEVFNLFADILALLIKKKHFNSEGRYASFEDVRASVSEIEETEKKLKERIEQLGITVDFEELEKLADSKGLIDADWNSSSAYC